MLCRSINVSELYVGASFTFFSHMRVVLIDYRWQFLKDPWWLQRLTVSLREGILNSIKVLPHIYNRYISPRYTRSLYQRCILCMLAGTLIMEGIPSHYKFLVKRNAKNVTKVRNKEVMNSYRRILPSVSNIFNKQAKNIIVCDVYNEDTTSNNCQAVDRNYSYTVFWQRVYKLAIFQIQYL